MCVTCTLHLSMTGQINNFLRSRKSQFDDHSECTLTSCQHFGSFCTAGRAFNNSHVRSAYSQFWPSFSPSPTEGKNWRLTIVTYQQVAVLGLGPKLVFDQSLDLTTYMDQSSAHSGIRANSTVCIMNRLPTPQWTIFSQPLCLAHFCCMKNTVTLNK